MRAFLSLFSPKPPKIVILNHPLPPVPYPDPPIENEEALQIEQPKLLDPEERKDLAEKSYYNLVNQNGRTDSEVIKLTYGAIKQGIEEHGFYCYIFNMLFYSIENPDTAFSKNIKHSLGDFIINYFDNKDSYICAEAPIFIPAIFEGKTKVAEGEADREVPNIIAELKRMAINRMALNLTEEIPDAAIVPDRPPSPITKIPSFEQLKPVLATETTHQK